MALTNRKLYPQIDTVFLMTDERYLYLSSSIIKEIVSFGGQISGLVPKCVEESLYKKFLV
jgi:pantetheine-phosphate adenylyltransferase